MGRSNRRSDEEGQATVEFVLALVMVMSFVLFYIQTALGLAWANYVQYATFMSARAYYSSGQNEADQGARAKKVAIQMLKKGSSGNKDRFGSIGKGDGGSDADVKGLSIGAGDQFKAGDPDYSWMEGVRYRFKGRLFMLPFPGNSAGAGPDNTLMLQSESWLGREPTVDECDAYMSTVKGSYDNGC